MQNGGIFPNLASAVINNYGTIVNIGPYGMIGGYEAGVIFNSAIINQYYGSRIIGNGLVNGNSPVFACFPMGIIAYAANHATGQSMLVGARTFYGQKFGTGATIISSVVDCATVKIRKFGSPTGSAEIGFYDSNMNLIKQLGTKDVTTLTTSYKPYEFCLPSSDIGHSIQVGEILAVKYNAGDSLNRIEVRRSNVGSGLIMTVWHHTM